MTRDSRNQPGGRDDHSDRFSNENQDRKRFDDFGSMNYEQIRQPYHPEQRTSGRDGELNGDHERKDC